MRTVNLCKNCIEMLKEHNPYTEQVSVREVSEQECDNYTVDGIFVNLEKGDR